jgi:predicted acylesterase/phospholipase RssA
MLNAMHPFQHLALSLSGGGYRAAAFHLGSMAYLHQLTWQDKPLLSRLSVISTISGGTITGMKYALSLAEGKSFEQFYAELYQFLKEDQLLGHALAMLNNDEAWGNSTKQRNLINAFSLVYHRELLGEKTFKTLLDLPADQYPEMLFNSTDLENQLAFRFQKSHGGLIGNGKANLPETAARDLRLADIVAASSCFPGGFEPLRFPLDFQSGPDDALAQAWKNKPELRLLDGGIVDNQGIESVLLFEGRKGKKEEPFVSSWFVSDVTRKELRFEEESPAKSSPFFLQFSVRTYNRLAFVFLLLAGYLLWQFMSKWVVFLAAFLILSSGLWLALSFLAVHFVAGQLKKTVSRHASSIRNLNILRTVPLKYVVAQIQTRLLSVGRLPDVFMKRIRDQGYNSLFSDRHWKYRVKTNLIYDLNDPKLNLGASLRAQVEKANQMGTTLWFAEETPGTPPMLDALIATGKATMCHNIIEYIDGLRKLGTLPPDILADLEEVQGRCKADWAEMNG